MRQLKIPLFPISSLDESQAGSIGGQAEDISGNTSSGVQRSTSTTQRRAQGRLSDDDHGHGRSNSLGNEAGNSRRQEQSGLETPDRLFRGSSPVPTLSPLQPTQRATSPRMSTSPEKPLPARPSEASAEEHVVGSGSAAPSVFLKPHVVSPSPQEFLLVTGTGPSDPGVGIFVNLEGDVTRSTLEFEKYPDGLVSDGRGQGVEISPSNMEEDEEGYVLASMTRVVEGSTQYGLEIQRWDIDSGEVATEKFWLPVPEETPPTHDVSKAYPCGPGVRSVTEFGDLNFDDVVQRLRLKRFRPIQDVLPSPVSPFSQVSSDSRSVMSIKRVSGEKELFDAQRLADEESLRKDREANRNEEELQFAVRLGRARTRLVVWSHNNIWWVIRNPLLLRLEASLERSEENSPQEQIDQKLDRRKLVEVVNSLRGREAKTELEFVSFGYVRQRAGLMILMSLLDPKTVPSVPEDRFAEDALLEGSLDPRVVLALIPKLRDQIIEGKNGIWVHGGVERIATAYIKQMQSQNNNPPSAPNEYVLQFLRRFLMAWRRKKGFGSIADETEIFLSVDAALLVVLLELDKSTPRGPARAGSNRAEINDLVDHGMDCLDRAVQILESYHRLYLLSRLYQSRKMSSQVLSTWRRIIEGEVDDGGELSDGEQIVRNYLSNIKNQALVEEYGVWLASRNTKLGIEVFADDRSRVKLEVAKVVDILRRGAPAAVKDYLEYLVFGKNHTEYVNDLIAYYLDIAIHKLETSESARTTLNQTYETYRALKPPKPTYREFITDNAIPEEWWNSRLRLLQLLGGSHGSASEYDVEAILRRIAPFEKELVPEMTILYGRQSQHEAALKLLTHGLGDYDTAINYCLLGGSSIYHPIQGSRDRESLPSRDEQAKLFRHLLTEFLQLEDVSDRVEQTGNLLERFGRWFDISYVLDVIPDTWSVELVSAFLISALRRMVRERHEAMVAKALSGAENLKVNADLIDKIEEIGPSTQNED